MADGHGGTERRRAAGSTRDDGCAVVAVATSSIHRTIKRSTMLSASLNSTRLATAAKPVPAAHRRGQRPVCQASAADHNSSEASQGRRQALAALAAVAAAAAVGGGGAQPAAAASDFVQTASGLLIQDIT